MDIPNSVKNAGLYDRLQEDSELLNALLSLRTIAERLADKISCSVPGFTDHSIRHMDALWGVTDRVLTKSELSRISLGEAFLLTCGFYLHDIGMAYAATDEGLDRIRSSSVYASFIAGLSPHRRGDTVIQARAISLAVRKLHASAAMELATAPVPGTGNIYLFESKTIREAWAETCGRIASSHHWSLETVERDLGSAGLVPLPGGREADLAYVAAILRLVDYAHINRDRASTIDRAFRGIIERDSLIHWLAQERIDGPLRESNDLVYHAAGPISDVDAWWLYYEMLTGLNSEIRAVRRYLDRRSASKGRLSLEGVRGTGSPEEASVYIPTSGFLPIEVNLRTGSIDRLVQLLAGESLYGPDPMVAVRELIQNARDAVMLKSVLALNEAEKAVLSVPIRIAMKTTEHGSFLEVIDWGVGMTRRVMTDYLLSIASDYWTSQFHIDFPSATDRGFRPAGKFGIGFLSVFMLGDEIAVESNRDGGERCQLTLRGVGRRGEIRTVASPSGSGTSIRIRVKDSVVEPLRQLPDLVRVYAPMLSHALTVEVDGKAESIPAGWLYELSAKEFQHWIVDAVQKLLRNRGGGDRDHITGLGYYRFRRYRLGESVDNQEPWVRDWPEYRDKNSRLVASFDGISLLCLKGLAIQSISTPGFVGIIDLETAIPDVSRRQLIKADVTDILNRATLQTRAGIVENLNALKDTGFLINKMEFIARCVDLYGRESILESSVPWVSTIKLPGNVELVSSATLLTKLIASRSLFLAYDTGPWTAMKHWESSDIVQENTELAIVLDDTHGDGAGYHSGNSEEVGRLIDIWPRCERACLFGTILRIAAEAWQVSLEELAQQDGWHHSGSTIWGRLVRP